LKPPIVFCQISDRLRVNGVDSLAPRLLGEPGLLSGVVLDDSSLMQRLARSIVFSLSTTIPLQYCGYFAKTYCLTYCISLCVIGPEHLRSRPWIVDKASAIRWAGIMACAFCSCQKWHQIIHIQLETKINHGIYVREKSIQKVTRTCLYNHAAWSAILCWWIGYKNWWWIFKFSF